MGLVLEGLSRVDMDRKDNSNIIQAFQYRVSLPSYGRLRNASSICNSIAVLVRLSWSRLSNIERMKAPSIPTISLLCLEYFKAM